MRMEELPWEKVADYVLLNKSQNFSLLRKTVSGTFRNSLVEFFLSRLKEVQVHVHVLLRSVFTNDNFVKRRVTNFYLDEKTGLWMNLKLEEYFHFRLDKYYRGFNFLSDCPQF